MNKWEAFFDRVPQPQLSYEGDGECRNCGSQTSGHFCGACGQRHIEFNIYYLWEKLFEAISLQRGLLYNLKVLTFIPGTSIRNYMEGRTRPYLNPISYSLLILALLFLTGSQFISEVGIQKYSERFPFFIHYLIFTYPGTFAFGSMLAFARNKYHFVQHFIIALFVISHFMLIVIIPLQMLDYHVSVHLIWMFFIYAVWVYHLIFRKHVLETIIDIFIIMALSFAFEFLVVALTIGWLIF